MVETRSKSKSVANLTVVEVERSHRDRTDRSRRDRAASTTAIEDVSASSARIVTQTADASTSVPASSRCTKRPTDTTSSHHRVEAHTSSTNKTHSCCSKERSQSSRSAATVRAQKLAIEAELLRSRVARQRELSRQQAEREQLARLEFEAEQKELEAKLAALDAKDKSAHSHSSRHSIRDTEIRTATWVSQQNANMTMAHVNIPGNAPTVTLDDNQGPILQPAALPTTVSSHIPHVNHANQSKPARTIGDNYTTVARLPSTEHPPADPIAQLTHAINSLSNHPKKPDLVPFSGDVNQWMAFKSCYERTKLNFSATENLTRLNNAIRGPAYQAVASLLWTSCDPQAVMSTLEQTYARPEILVAREVAELRNTPKLSSPEDLNSLANRLRNFVATLKLVNQYDYLYSPELFRIILLKLTEHTRARFTDFAATHVSEQQCVAKIELLSQFLLVEADKQLRYNFVQDYTIKPHTIHSRVHSNIKKETIHVTASNSKTSECTYCKQGCHSIKSCKIFLSLTVDNRWRWVRDNKVCYRCLKSNPHKWNNCRAKCCGVNGCSRRHNSLLHGTPPDDIKTSPTSNIHCTQIPLDITTVPTDIANEPIKVANTSDILINTTGAPSRPRGLLKVLPVILEGPDGEYETTALLDEGSTATLIDNKVAMRIGAKPACQERLRIEGVNGMSKDVDVGYVNFYIRGRNLSDRYLVEHARAINPLSLRVRSQNITDYMDYQHLSDLSEELSCANATPSVLIGAPDWHLSLSREVRCGKRNEPVASRTLLGWVLHGAMSSSSKPLDFVNYVCDDLDNLIKRQYEIDSLGITKNLPLVSDDDKRAIDTIENSARQLEDNHYEVGLPWKKVLPTLIPDSYPQALSRLRALERQMSKDESFAAAYHNFINDIVRKGYAEECDPQTYYKRRPQNISCTNPNGTIRWYLPTFGVFHPQKKKLRVVHDAAATSKSVSFNSLLLQGPDLLCSLLDILFRFREGAVALNADIKEMFPQIKIAEKDRDAQRFLWRNKDGTIMEYRMKAMIFGAVCSPFIALYIKNKNAKKAEATYPLAYKAIVEDHYMDDYLGSHSNVTEAAQIASDIITVHKTCGFEMRGWISNNSQALSLVPKNLRSESNSDVYLPPNNDVGILGVKWNPLHDSLTFRTGHQLPDVLTKRSLLSNIMKVYDPLGLLMPIIISGRILFQKLWRAGIDWDTPIPHKFIVECEDWYTKLQGTANIKIARWYMCKSDPIDVQLHVVADGGEQAYACVAYWRFTYNDGSISTALIGSKARVAPLKPLSIPRLELQAALIASRFAQTILRAHRFNPSTITYWTDSTTVLKWIRSDARTFKPFVAHRLGEILETTNPCNWRWIPTSLNVADDATKPKNIDLSLSHRWFTGPPFLLEPPLLWPTENESDAEEISPDPELKSELVMLLSCVQSPDPPVPIAIRFSSWPRLLRATARVLQGARLFRLKLSRPININSKLFLDDTTSPSQLRVRDVIEAEKMLFRRAQIDSFPGELKAIQTTQPLPRNSRIATLAPVLDEDGLLRIDSRIKRAPDVCENAKSPIILDGRHHIARLLILHHHIQSAHAFNELILNEIRQRFWILRARNTIRSVVHTCMQCRRWKGKVIKPQTGDLPLERVDHSKRPFTHVGLDYFGPIVVTVHRRNEKRYVALYTCLVTRALHLEVVPSLSADAAIMSLRRFIARRGSPCTIYSDNGTNFVGAFRELRCLYDDPVVEYATNHKIEWHFIPPASPFMGGAWERLVRTVKTALRSCLSRKTIKEETLVTLLLEAEAIINARPLTYISPSPHAPEALTPFHFILGTSSTTPWTSSLTDADLVRRCDWRRVLRLADHFWARWLREYLPTLRSRGPHRGTATVAEGDVVLIADSSLPRGLWPLGRIVKVYPGPDGVVRVADVLTKGGTLRRPVRKLILMQEEPQSVATSS
ncbi:uncharacterized protein LOC131846565 [Achroia grisella]|uniref:uncharacterized protein LOC131846565 n=1 Tax=Achroia grisella TaxID=688607 RepID=UPI0027D207FF|nr:uncharacterized protein LOC131846565 [Achroia grisella]